MVVVQPTKKGEKMWTDNLRQFHFWCQKTLPLVYDDSLSYYEVLAKVTKHLNELTTLVNEIGDELERYEGVTDDRLDTLETWRTEVDTWRAQIDQWKTDVNTWIEQTDAWKQSTENHLTAHDNWISYATGLINNTIMPFIEDMTTRVADIETRLSGAEDDIDALEGRMDTAENDIDTLQSDVTSLDGRLDDAESAITGLDGRLDTAEDDIDTLQSDVTSLDGRLDTAEDDIDNLESSMSTAEGDIDDIQDDVTDLQNRMSTAETNLLNLSGNAIVITSRIISDSANNRWLLDMFDSNAVDYLMSKIDDYRFLHTAISSNTVFIIYNIPSSYNNETLVLSYNGTAKQYENQDIIIPINAGSTSYLKFTEFANHNLIFILDTTSTTAASILRLLSSETGGLPYPTNSLDDGKVVAYNFANKNYELITPSSSAYVNYSTTEHLVGKWMGNDIYEITYYLGSLPNNNSISLTLPSDISMICDIKGVAMSTNALSVRPVPFWDASSTNSIRLEVSYGILEVTTYDNWPDYVIYVTIRYTKI